MAGGRLPSFIIAAMSSKQDLVGLILMSLVSGAGQFLIILPFRYANAATLGPVQYFSIVRAG